MNNAKRKLYDDLILKIQKLMQDALPLDVPLIVDCGVGQNWLQAH